MTLSEAVPFSATVLERAKDFGTATLHEAAGQRGALPCEIHQITTGIRIAGRALTVECPPMDNLWLHRAITVADPGDVLVATVGGASEGGYWGEILSRAAAARGLGGLVIDGGVRDTGKLAEVGLPVFARCVCIRGTGKETADQYGGLGQPITFRDVTVRTGDLVVGDEDGVAVIPAEDVDDVLVAAAARVSKENTYIDRIGAGATTLELMGFPWTG